VEGVRVKRDLNHALPVWHHRERHELHVKAPPDLALRAVREVSAAEMPFARMLLRVRGLRPTRAVSLVDAMLADGFVRFSDDVLVLVGRPWSPKGDLLHVDDFAAFHDAGYAKMALDFTATPEGEGTRLATETRVFLTDDGARRRFAAYWLVVRPFSGLVRRSWLAAAKRRAEAESAAARLTRVDIVPDPIDAYAEAHTTPPTELLAALAEETRATMSAPQMLTGTVEGRFLELLVFGTGARRVLEIGTFTGYSALSMAAALPEGGRIDTCDIEPKHVEVAQRYVDQSPYADRITIHLGPALETIARLEGTFDLVFIDADKPNYANYYEAVLPRLSARGLIAIDNTLWSGRVLDPQDEQSQAIAALNDAIAADERVVAVQLTVRDGVTLVRRR
jgi:caffeoyl-CoA O-methyltransferase